MSEEEASHPANFRVDKANKQFDMPARRLVDKQASKKQTCRQTGRQTDWQAGKQANKQTMVEPRREFIHRRVRRKSQL